MVVHDPGIPIDFTLWGWDWRSINWSDNLGTTRYPGILEVLSDRVNVEIVGSPQIEHMAVWNQGLAKSGDYDIAFKVRITPWVTWFFTGLQFPPNTTHKEVDYDNSVSVQIIGEASTGSIRTYYRKNGVVVESVTKSSTLISTTDVWVRIAKEGTTYRTYVSDDGVNWDGAATINNTDLSGDHYFGITYLTNTSSTPRRGTIFEFGDLDTVVTEEITILQAPAEAEVGTGNYPFFYGG